MTPKPAITDREPDAWRNDRGHVYDWYTDAEARSPGDTPLWLVSADDLAARDEAVRREVREDVLRKVYEAAGKWLEEGDDLGDFHQWLATMHIFAIGLPENDEATPHADEEAGS